MQCQAVGSTCQRCQRLGITCDGLGQVRYMFKDEAEKFTKAPAGPQLAKTKALRTPAVPERIPSGDTMRLQSAFVANISTAIDIKYSLLWNFGIFITDVPRRLGCNEALDAAAKCLMTAYGPFCNGQRLGSETSLLEFGRALNALRRCLANPIVARTSETLCSVMILMIAQV